jgi:anaerobic nitric oxide reductase transcription regulator
VNCAAILATLAESELFGHVPGAFTGAVRRSEGVFLAAAGGTLFLDEIGELPPEVQAKLLRALAEGEIRPVGTAESFPADARVVAATNRDPEDDVAKGRFRADLLARLGGWRIAIPPLRSRRADILPLAQRFLERGGTAHLGVDAAEALLLHGYPHNVRELAQLVSAAALRAAAGDRGAAPLIKLEHLPAALAAALQGREPSSAAAPPPPLSLSVSRDKTPTREDLEQALLHFDGNVSEVARFFRRDRKQIYRWAAAFGLDLGDKRDRE